MRNTVSKYNNINRSCPLKISTLQIHFFLYIHFEGLRALIDSNELLAQILAIFNTVFDDLPDDQELASYYILGACSPFHLELAEIMQRTNIQALTQAPEMADKLASECSLSLQEKFLKQKLKKPSSLSEIRYLRQQLNELTKKIGLKLVNEE